MLNDNIDSDEVIFEDLDIITTVADSAAYIHCDDNVACYGDLSEAKLVQAITYNASNVENEELEDEEDIDPIEPPTLSEALSALNILQKYCFYKNIEVSFDQAETEIIKGSAKIAKQKSITDFFHSMDTS